MDGQMIGYHRCQHIKVNITTGERARERERERIQVGGGKSKMVALGILWVNGETNSPVRYIEGL